jgi:hypothetical protein
MPPKISKEMLSKRRFPLKEQELPVKAKSKMVQKEEKKQKMKLKYKK